MKEKLRQKVQDIAKNPKVKEAVVSMKPDRNIWGFLGVVVFFILPEIVAFIWGAEITLYANKALESVTGWSSYYYEGLVMLFGEGGSWFNLLLGMVFLVWLFF